ncbi:MAG: hypothetical protein QM758_01185 [Armatimonas sp.]
MKYSLFGAAAVATFALSGCGAVNSLIPDIDNLAALDGTTVDTTVGTGRAVISGNVSKTATFADRDLPQKSKLRRLKLRQSLNEKVTVTMPEGKPFPATFTLRNLELRIRVSDSETRAVETSASLAGPLTYTREGSTNVYALSAPVEISNITFDGSDFSTLRDIITTAPSPNTVVARFSLDAEDTELPSGTVLRFALQGGKAKVEL